MTRDELANVLRNISYDDPLGYEFEILEPGGMLAFRVAYIEADVDTGRAERQYGRTWFVPRGSATRSSVVRTAFAALMASAEHRVREHFRYRGEQVFSPHLDVDKLVDGMALLKEDA